MNSKPCKSLSFNVNSTKTDVDDLFGRIKQNGTVVYDHVNDVKQEISRPTQAVTSITPKTTGNSQDNRQMTFRERKELFNKPSVPVKQEDKQQQVTSKRQKIDDIQTIVHDNNGTDTDNEYEQKSSPTPTTKRFSNVKTKTFFAGKEVANGAPLNKMTATITSTKCTVEFLNAGIKLDKPAIIAYTHTTRRNVNFKVEFKDCHETYEYPSFESVLRDMGIDPDANDESDVNTSNDKDLNSSDQDENSLYFGESLNKKFDSFKPSWMFDYELGGNLSDRQLTKVDSRATVDSHQNTENEKQLDQSWSLELDSNILF
jgi:hypothetical protein